MDLTHSKGIACNLLYVSLKKQVEDVLQNNGFVSEKEVLYFLITIRKFLEVKGDLDSYVYLKFYSDWTVHPVKNGIPKEIKMIIEGLKTDKHNALKELQSMVQFKLQLKEFLNSLLIDIEAFFEKTAIWASFFKGLLVILDECPLIYYSSKDSWFEFTYNASTGFLRYSTSDSTIIGGAYKAFLEE